MSSTAHGFPTYGGSRRDVVLGEREWANVCVMHRFAFIEFSSAKEAAAVVKQFDRTPLDKKHTMLVNRLTDIDRYGREGRIDEQYTEPKESGASRQELLVGWPSRLQLRTCDCCRRLERFRHDRIWRNMLAK